MFEPLFIIILLDCIVWGFSAGLFSKPAFVNDLVQQAYFRSDMTLDVLASQHQLLVADGDLEHTSGSGELLRMQMKPDINAQEGKAHVSYNPDLTMKYGECVPSRLHKQGHVMLGQIKLYNLYVTTNSSMYDKQSSTVRILDGFAADFGGSDYANIAKSYYDPFLMEFLSADVKFVTSARIVLPPSEKSLSDDDITRLLIKMFKGDRGRKVWPYRTDAIYSIFYSGEMSHRSERNDLSLLMNSCGYHHSFLYNDERIKFQVIADTTGFPNYLHRAVTYGSCINFIFLSNWQMKHGYFTADMHSANNNAAADSMVDVFAHELFESMTDCTNGGWRSPFPSCLECSDVCMHYYGNHTNPYWNMDIKGHKYLLASKFTPKSNHCVLRLPS